MPSVTATRDSRVMRGLVTVLVSGVLLASCATLPTKTPVQGDQQALRALEGEWNGTYESNETGRRGDIYFTLRAGVDTAVGQILMTPRVENQVNGTVDGRAREIVSPALITIRFVAAEGDQVYGMLDPYRDPVCGCPLETRFSGRRSGDIIRGIFVSDGSGIFHHPTSGEWRVTRKRTVVAR